MMLGEVISSWRWARRMDVRTAAQQIGISPSTLNRIENGKSCDGESMAKLFVWLIAPVKGGDGTAASPAAEARDDK